MLMIWVTFCIVLIRVVVIQFYPKSCNSIGVLSLFSGKSCKSAKQDIKWRINDMNIEIQWLLEDIWRQYKVKKIHFNFQDIARRKNARKRVENCRIRTWGVVSGRIGQQYMLGHAPMRMRHASRAWGMHLVHGYDQ